MRREVDSTWSSREVNDVSHQNRALLPLVAATLRVEAERRFAAGFHLFPVSAASEAKQCTVGDAEHPFDNGMTT